MWDPKRLYQNREHPAPGPESPRTAETRPVVTAKVRPLPPVHARRPTGGSVVELRKEICRMLGYANYREYLASPLWRKIRRRIFGRARSICESCHETKAAVVHHLNYAPETLAGDADESLVAVCQRCHDRYHASDGKKRRAWKKFKHGSRDKAFRCMIANEAKRRKRKNSKLLGVRITTIDAPAIVSNR